MFLALWSCKGQKLQLKNPGASLFLQNHDQLKQNKYQYKNNKPQNLF